MAFSNAESPLKDRVFAVVGNIPSFYLVADVRWFFIDAIKEEWFLCFHYCYREDIAIVSNSNEVGPVGGEVSSTTRADLHEADVTSIANCHLNVSNLLPSCSNAGAENEITSTDPVISKEPLTSTTVECCGEDADDEEMYSWPCCCIVEFTNLEARSHFYIRYNDKPWLDVDGNSLEPDWRCRISLVRVHSDGENVTPTSTCLAGADAANGEHVYLSENSLLNWPYVEEICRTNPYPRGNVGTSRELLLDFVSCGRIDADTAGQLGLLDEPDDSEYADLMADLSGDFAYAVVYNIPPFYRSKHLRWHFEEFIDSGGFLMFNFQHRLSDLSTGMLTVPLGTDSTISPTTYQCLIKVSEANLERLLEGYHNQPWTDPEGNPLTLHCLLRPVREDEDIASKKVLKELYASSVFPRGNVGTSQERLWEAWEQGHISAPVAKRLGLFDDDETTHIPEDIEYERLSDGTMRKVSKKRKQAAKRRAAKRYAAEAEARQKEESTPGAPLGAFEAHTKGIGRKLMEKLGWTEGQGLGKELEGQAVPVAMGMQAAANKGGHKRGVGSTAGGQKRKRLAEAPLHETKMPFVIPGDPEDGGACG